MIKKSLNPETLTAELDRSFSKTVHDKTILLVRKFLYDGDKLRLNEKEILKWCALRAKQELEIAGICDYFLSKNLDADLRSLFEEQKEQETRHHHMLSNLVEKLGDEEVKKYFHNLKSYKDIRPEWNNFLNELKRQDPLEAMIALAYGHEAPSDAGIEVVEKIPYKPVAEIFKEIHRDEKLHADFGKIALQKLIAKDGNDINACKILNRYSSSQHVEMWPWKWWN